jgi:uncharacterized protein YdeI (BOF family)
MPHYIPRKIAEITEKDSFVSLVGRIAAVGDNFFVLEDKSGKIEIAGEELESNKLVRVFCSRVEGGWKADIVQELNDINLEIFEKAEEAFKAINT